ncbi:MAG: acyl carrier protein [Bacteroidales bacterium]|nr:acyl carrier protein [Bacteroidales bacterium]
MKDHIREILTDALPAVDFDADFLFSELDSLGVLSILTILSKEYGIELGAEDISPRNFRNLDSLTSLVKSKL